MKRYIVTHFSLTFFSTPFATTEAFSAPAFNNASLHEGWPYSNYIFSSCLEVLYNQFKQCLLGMTITKLPQVISSHRFICSDVAINRYIANTLQCQDFRFFSGVLSSQLPLPVF